ncbi:hypothetical protein G6F54_012300 [Rhizopus delemar]|nr:hypothetical protein G6F54_012300 [Rhizopus delemar]
MSYSNSISKEQKIFEIEERVYTLLAPELKNKYTAYRKVQNFPEEQRKPLSRLTSTYFDRTAQKLATEFISNNNYWPDIKEYLLEENTMNNNIDMQDLAQVIATAVATAINNKSTNENANVRIPIPSSYNGERSAAIINLWLQEVERYLEFNCVPQQRWLPYAITLLRGRAQKWWNQLSQKNEESVTWEKFKIDLEYAFKPSYSEQSARDRLASIKQTTSVSEYADAFQDILLDLPRVSDDEALDRFVRGLKNDVRIHVLTKEPRSLEEANRFAIAYDSAKQTGIVLPTRQRDSFADDPMDLSVLMQQLNAIVKAPRNNYYNQGRITTKHGRNEIFADKNLRIKRRWYLKTSE